MTQNMKQGQIRGFSKKNCKFSRPFFQADQIDFPKSAKAPKRPSSGHIFCAAGKILKKQAKKDEKTGQQKTGQKRRQMRL